MNPIEQFRKGAAALLRGDRARQVVAFVNAVLRLRVAVGNRSEFLVTDQNAILTIGRGLLTDAVQAEGFMRYRGTYDAATAYNSGDVVRVTTSTNNKGMWVCVAAGITGVAPVEGANWNNISLGPHLTDVCLDGETLQANVNRALATGE